MAHTELYTHDPKLSLLSTNPDAALINTSFIKQIEVNAMQEPDVVDLMAVPSYKHCLHFFSANATVSNPLLAE